MSDPTPEQFSEMTRLSGQGWEFTYSTKGWTAKYRESRTTAQREISSVVRLGPYPTAKALLVDVRHHMKLNPKEDV